MFTVDTHENVGIHVSSVWEFIDWLESQERNESVAAQTTSGTGTVSPSRSYPHDSYQAFPQNWNGETLAP